MLATGSAIARSMTVGNRNTRARYRGTDQPRDGLRAGHAGADEDGGDDGQTRALASVWRSMKRRPTEVRSTPSRTCGWGPLARCRR
jgi:hypothetical protein